MMISSSHGFIININSISDCSDNISANISNNSKIKLLTYDIKYGLCISNECYKIERIVDFSCNFENKIKNNDDFPTEKTIWYSLHSNKNITTYYDGKTLTCVGDKCPILFECTSRNPDDLIDISFNYYNNKLLIKNNQNQIDIYINNYEMNTILMLYTKLNIISVSKTLNSILNIFISIIIFIY